MTFVVPFLVTSKEYFTMSQVATAAVVDGKMEPAAPAPIVRPLVVTGEYLYNTFVVADDAQITKMGIIRQLADIADALQIKGAADNMVKKAVLVDWPTGKPKGADRGPKEQSAMNTRTVIQQAWGALRFARGNLDALGYDDKTGYQDMRVLAKRALDAARVDWKGDALKTEAQKETARLQRDNKEQVAALQDVQKDNPFDSRIETLPQWNERTFKLAESAMQQARADKETSLATKEAEKLIGKYGPNVLFQIAELLLDAAGVEVTETPETEPEAEEVTE
jgi:hypothetical protein